MTFLEVVIVATFLLCYLVKLRRIKKRRSGGDQSETLEEVRARALERSDRLDREHEKRVFEYRQAESDFYFYRDRVEVLTRMIYHATEALGNAQAIVEDDSEKNQYGQAVSIKMVNKHIRELERAEKAVITLENQLHTAQQKIEKAEFTLTH